MANINKRVAFKPNSDYQVAVLASRATELFAGGLPGGGKSACLIACHTVPDEAGSPRCAHPLYEGWTFRRNDDQLSGLIRYAREIFPIFGGQEIKDGREWRFPRGGRHYFSHMNSEGDWKQVQGHNVSDMDFDELPEFTEMQYGMAKTWARSPHEDLPVRIRSTGNPIGPGVAWVKEYFVNRCVPFQIEHIAQSNGKTVTRQFIPWGFRDNPDLLRNDPDYEARLHQIPNPTIRRAMLSDDVMAAWNVVVGSFFNFSSEEHIVPYEDEAATWDFITRQSARYIRAYDYGGNAPTVMLWIVQLADGSIYVTHEYYVENQPTLDVHIPAVLDIEASITDADGHIIVPELTVGDPSIWSRKPQYVRRTQRSIGQIWQQHGIYIAAANNDKVPGFEAIHQALYYTEDMPPRMRVFQRCQNAIRELSGATCSNDDPERMADKQPDHAIDCLRYGLMHLLGVRGHSNHRRARPGSWMDSFQKHIDTRRVGEQSVNWGFK